MGNHMQVKISLHPYDITNSNFKSQQKPLNDFIMYVLRHELGTGGWTEPVEEHKATIRCLLDNNEFKSCFACEMPSKSDVIIGKAY
mgnify:CR=1 FL=1